MVLKVHKREDGKFIKAPTYSPANLKRVIEEQIEECSIYCPPGLMTGRAVGWFRFRCALAGKDYVAFHRKNVMPAIASLTL